MSSGPVARQFLAAENLTEAAAARILVLLGYTVRPHAVKLQLANGAWYQPDLLAWRPGEALVLVEVKPLKQTGKLVWRRAGNLGDASRVKWKVAAALYPEFRWLALGVARDGAYVGEWYDDRQPFSG